jgi:hypothetical protein
MGGTHIASAEEMENALEQQKQVAVNEKLLTHNQAVKDHFESIAAIKWGLATEDYAAAYEAFSELNAAVLNDLRLASTQGGIFTTAETAQMKSNEWTAARHEFHGHDTTESAA